jgi:amino acid permease
MRINNKTALKITAILSLGMASIIYITFGLFNYMTFGDKIQRNIFCMFPQDSLTTGVSIFYFFIVLMSVPLQTNPCRVYLLNLFNIKYLTENKYQHIRSLASFSILFSAFILATINSSFERFCEKIGGSFSTLMCFIFAGVYYFIAFKHKGFGEKKLMASFVLLYGGLSFLSLFFSTTK